MRWNHFDNTESATTQAERRSTVVSRSTNTKRMRTGSRRGAGQGFVVYLAHVRKASTNAPTRGRRKKEVNATVETSWQGGIAKQQKASDRGLHVNLGGSAHTARVPERTSREFFAVKRADVGHAQSHTVICSAYMEAA